MDCYPKRRYKSYYRRSNAAKRFPSDDSVGSRRSYKTNYANIGKYRKFSRGGYYWKGGLYGRFSGLGGLKPEMKYYDSNISGFLIPNGGANILTTVVNMQRGTAPIDRIGVKVMIRSIQAKFEIAAANQGDTNFNALRPDGTIKIIIYQDTQCNGTVAAANEIFRTAIDNGAGTPGFPNRMRDVTYSARYKVLWESIIKLDGQITTAVNQFTPASGLTTSFAHFVSFERKHVEMFKKVAIPVEYDGQAGVITVANIRTNNIGVIVGCNTDFDQMGALAATVRVRYTDS